MDINNVWLITAKTNLHVGNENSSSYGLIDKAIQRDALTGLPCINSSSLKGALNEFAAQGANLSADERIRIFGGDKKNKNAETKKGSYVFFDANILLLPKQDDDSLYKLVTCDEVLASCVNKMNALGIAIKKDEFDLKLPKHSSVSPKEFKELCSDDNLPIIARNCLENGESTNLWYEQILPAETVLFTVIDDKDDKVLHDKIIENIVQIGANATIGYGYCKFTNL